MSTTLKKSFLLSFILTLFHSKMLMSTPYCMSDSYYCCSYLLGSLETMDSLGIELLITELLGSLLELSSCISDKFSFYALDSSAAVFLTVFYSSGSEIETDDSIFSSWGELSSLASSFSSLLYVPSWAFFFLSFFFSCFFLFLGFLAECKFLRYFILKGLTV